MGCKHGNWDGPCGECDVEAGKVESASHEHLYGDEPECALCGHYGPDNDPKPCISRIDAGKLVHGLKGRLALAENSFKLTSEENDRWRNEVAQLRQEKKKAEADLHEAGEAHLRVTLAFNTADERLKEASAACAEMRAVLKALLPLAFPVDGGSDGCGTVGGWTADLLNDARALLARTDLGRGRVAVVVPWLRQVRAAIVDCLDDIHETWIANEDCEGSRSVASTTVNTLKRVQADLDALLDGGRREGSGEAIESPGPHSGGDTTGASTGQAVAAAVPCSTQGLPLLDGGKVKP